MKKTIFCIAMLLISSVAMGQAKPTKVAEKKSNTKIEKVDNKTFKATKSSGASSYVATGYSYIDTDGKTYEIYSHKITRGDRAGQTAYYIKKVSKKSGKEYWKEINIIL